MNNKKRKIPKVEQAIEALDLPGELILGIPCISVVGDREATVENYNGIIEYDEKKVILSTSLGIFRIKGENLSIKSITDEDVTLSGRVLGFDIDAD